MSFKTQIPASPSLYDGKDKQFPQMNDVDIDKVIEVFNQRYRKKIMKAIVVVLPACVIILLSLLGAPVLI